MSNYEGLYGALIGAVLTAFLAWMASARKALQWQGEMQYRLSALEKWKENEYPGEVAHLTNGYKTADAVIRSEIDESNKQRGADHDSIIELRVKAGLSAGQRRDS